ncbi:cell adhesion molecule CEACAM5-like [Synchiropus picturatus]
MSAGVLPDSLDTAVGGTVMFSTTLSPAETPLTVVWCSRGPIITSTPTANITDPDYEGSITLFRSTGSLELRDVLDGDIGQYRVTIVTTERKKLTGSTDLRVHVPITGAQLSLSSEDLLEFNSSVTFSCSVSSGSSLSFLWQNISSDISASDGVRITDGGAKLTVLNVTRYDQGPFRCSVFNPVSRVLTDPLTLSISYGPDDVYVQVSPSQEHFEEGSNIRLSCSSSSSPPARLQWFVNGTLLPNTGAELLYEGRIRLFRSTGSLELENVSNNDRGTYKVSLVITGGEPRHGSTDLRVHVPITGAQLTPSSEDLLEFNSSVTFSCSVSSGSSLSFLWQNISSEISASDGVRITDGGAKLTVLNVTRYDQGPFRCSVFNPVSRVLTDPLTLSISYGPDDVDLQVSPSQEHFEEGSNIRLSCSSSSSPPARLQWFVNSTLLPNTGAELVLTAATEAQSGAYSCQAFNSKTLRYRTSAAAVTVLGPITAAQLSLSSEDLLEFNSSVTFSCSVSSGSSLSFLWQNISSEISASDGVRITDGGAKLTVLNVTRYDQGPFRCSVFNPVSRVLTDPLTLSISYGPDDVDVQVSPSQEHFEEGSNIRLSCSSSSSPPARLQWFVNGTLLPNTGAELVLTAATEAQSGAYSCQAFNSKTLRYRTSSAAVTVLGKISAFIRFLNTF